MKEVIKSLQKHLQQTTEHSAHRNTQKFPHIQLP